MQREKRARGTILSSRLARQLDVSVIIHACNRNVPTVLYIGSRTPRNVRPRAGITMNAFKFPGADEKRHKRRKTLRFTIIRIIGTIILHVTLREISTPKLNLILSLKYSTHHRFEFPIQIRTAQKRKATKNPPPILIIFVTDDTIGEPSLRQKSISTRNEKKAGEKERPTPNDPTKSSKRFSSVVQQFQERRSHWLRP